jgi:hypothetical protein
VKIRIIGELETVASISAVIEQMVGFEGDVYRSRKEPRHVRWYIDLDDEEVAFFVRAYEERRKARE